MLDPGSFQLPVVFFANAIGDHLIVLPALRALSRLFPGRLSLITLPEADVEFFSDITFQSVLPIPYVNPKLTHWRFSYHKAGLLPFDHNRLARQVGHCDLFISLALWHSPDLQCLLERLSPRVSLGFFDEFTHRLNSQQANSFDIAFASVHAFDPSTRIEDFANPPLVAEKYTSLTWNLRKMLDPDRRLLIVHTDTKLKKMWLPQEFLAAVDGFLSSRPDYLAMVIGNYHRLPLEFAVNKDRIFDVCGIPVGLSIALLGVADLFLGIDSCMLHAADLACVPGVGIFGPTDPYRWGFRFARHIHLFNSEGIDHITSKQALDAMLTLCTDDGPHCCKPGTESVRIRR